MLASVVAFVVGASSVDVAAAAAVVLTATAVDSAGDAVGDAVGTLDVEGMLGGS